jgi:phosphopantothenoylcysteine decarboxylase / phosphopantothenate---cysteine ligase
MLTGKRILLIIGGGIAAYKSLDLIRRLRERGAQVRCILTKAGHKFIAFGRRAGRRARLHRPVRSAERIRRWAYPACA